MTNFRETLEKIIDDINEKMIEGKFPMQRNIFRDDDDNETLIFSILTLCKIILSKHIEYHIEEKILMKEDYETLRKYFQIQRNLIAAELKVILRVLYNKEKKLARVKKLQQIIIENTHSEKMYMSQINKENRRSATEEFDGYPYYKDFKAYNDWLEENSLQRGSFPITYSIYHDLDYDNYFNIACMEKEADRVNAENMTPERFATESIFPEDVIFITKYTIKKDLKKLSASQLQNGHETLKLALNQLMSTATLKDKESTRAMKEYWNFMNRLEEEQQRRMGKSRYIKLK